MMVQVRSNCNLLLASSRVRLAGNRLESWARLYLLLYIPSAPPR